jgi:hypothetical protein
MTVTAMEVTAPVARERAGMDSGKVWIEAMAETLGRLDALCTQPGNWPGPS